MAEKRGLGDQTAAASAATSSYEAGNPVYPPAAAVLGRQGLDPAGKRSVPLTQADGAAYDPSLAWMRRTCGTSGASWGRGKGEGEPPFGLDGAPG